MVTAPKNPAELGLVAQALAQDRGVQLGLVFGSVARGTSRPGSDVDVAVLGATDALKLAQLVSERTGRDAHVVRLEDASIPLLQSLIDEAVVAYEVAPGLAASWRSRTLADLELDRPWYARQRNAWLKRVAGRGLL